MYHVFSNTRFSGLGQFIPIAVAPPSFPPHFRMTTQAENILQRLPGVPIRVQRFDRTTYWETDAEEMVRMLKSGIVEGVGPRSGRIDLLRITCTQDEAVKRMKEVTIERIQESAGSITSMASREVYRESLQDGHWCWAFKANRTIFA